MAIATSPRTPVGLGKIAKLINAGKIDSSELITMKTLKDTSAIGKQIKDGVRLMGRGAEQIKWPIHLEATFIRIQEDNTFSVGGRDLIVDGSITLSFERNYGLVGRNGTGKTTFLRYMAMHAIEGIPNNCQILHVEQEVGGDWRKS